jgi:hypothetical protein
MATNNLVTGGANTSQIMSLRDFQKRPDITDELHKLYGKGYELINFFHNSPGRVEVMSNESCSGEEENFTWRTLKLGGTITKVTTVVYTITLDAAELDAQNNFFPRVGFSVMVGNTITGFTECRIDSIDISTPATPVLTIKSYSSTAPTLDAQVSAGNLVTGIELPITASAFAVGTHGTTPTNLGSVQRTFYAQIMKEALGFDGMAMAQMKWQTYNEGTKFFNKEITRGEFMLEIQQEQACVFGQLNTENLTQTSVMSGAAGLIGKTQGIWDWIDQLGGDIRIGASGVGIDDLTSVEGYMVQKGLQDTVVACYGGYSALSKLMANSNAKIQGTSGGLAGTPYVQSVADKLYGGDTKMINFNLQYIKMSHITFVLIPSPLFSNPTMMGTANTKLDDAIMFIPLNQEAVTIDRKKVTVPNLRKRYVGQGAYSRERICGMLAGMDGYMNQTMRYPIITDVDGSNVHWTSHTAYELYGAFRGVLATRSS